MFYQFCADMEEIDNPILMHDISRPQNMFKSILHHARSDNQTKQSIFKVKESDYAIRLATDDEIKAKDDKIMHVLSSKLYLLYKYELLRVVS